jgi:hypothetical protein
VKYTPPPAPLAPNDHVEIGNRMKEVRGVLMYLVQRLRPDTALHRDTVQTIQTLDHLRTQLDCLLHLSVSPNKDPRHMLPHVYSGTERLYWRDYGPEETDKDDLVVWGQERRPWTAS